MLIVVMLRVTNKHIMLSVVMLSVIMLNVVMMSVMAPGLESPTNFEVKSPNSEVKVFLRLKYYIF